MGLSLTELLVEYLRSPLGLDEQAPRFSWKLSSDKKDTMQNAVEIRVREANTEEEVWDSGVLSTGVSTGIIYEGKELKPCTAYVVQVEVTDNYGRKAVAETIFETGFLKNGLKASGKVPTGSELRIFMWPPMPEVCSFWKARSA